MNKKPSNADKYYEQAALQTAATTAINNIVDVRNVFLFFSLFKLNKYIYVYERFCFFSTRFLEINQSKGSRSRGVSHADRRRVRAGLLPPPADGQAEPEEERSDARQAGRSGDGRRRQHVQADRVRSEDRRLPRDIRAVVRALPEARADLERGRNKVRRQADTHRQDQRASQRFAGTLLECSSSVVVLTFVCVAARIQRQRIPNNLLHQSWYEKKKHAQKSSNSEIHLNSIFSQIKKINQCYTRGKLN